MEHRTLAQQAHGLVHVRCIINAHCACCTIVKQNACVNQQLSTRHFFAASPAELLPASLPTHHESRTAHASFATHARGQVAGMGEHAGNGGALSQSLHAPVESAKLREVCWPGKPMPPCDGTSTGGFAPSSARLASLRREAAAGAVTRTWR
jgi:hypothetical protein